MSDEMFKLFVSLAVTAENLGAEKSLIAQRISERIEWFRREGQMSFPVVSTDLPASPQAPRM
jgi:hypothetical protein